MNVFEYDRTYGTVIGECSFRDKMDTLSSSHLGNLTMRQGFTHGQLYVI